MATHDHEGKPIPKLYGEVPRAVYNQDPEKGGIKWDGGKVRFELIPPEAVYGAAKVFTYGAKKYADNNWAKGMNWMRLFGSLSRHIWSWAWGQDLDPDTGFHHLDMALCNLMMLRALVARDEGEDDRYSITLYEQTSIDDIHMDMPEDLNNDT